MRITQHKNNDDNSITYDDLEENFVITDVEVSKIRSSKFAEHKGVCRNEGEGLRDLRTNHS